MQQNTWPCHTMFVLQRTTISALLFEPKTTPQDDSLYFRASAAEQGKHLCTAAGAWRAWAVQVAACWRDGVKNTSLATLASVGPLAAGGCINLGSCQLHLTNGLNGNNSMRMPAGANAAPTCTTMRATLRSDSRINTGIAIARTRHHRIRAWLCDLG